MFLFLRLVFVRGFIASQDSSAGTSVLWAQDLPSNKMEKPILKQTLTFPPYSTLGTLVLEKKSYNKEK